MTGSFATRARRLFEAIRERPWLIVVAVAAVAAIAFPRVAAGSFGLLILAGFAGIGVTRVWQRRVEKRGAMPASEPRVPPRLGGWIAIMVVIGVAAYVFVPVFEHSVMWVGGDWPPQHAVLRGVVDHLRDGEWPYWNQRISTGDPSLDVYPSFTYVIAATIAIVADLDDGLPVVLVVLAVLAHTLIAVGATRLALRFLRPWIAAAIGVVLVLDQGSISSGGVIGTIKTGLLHSAVAQVFSLLAIVAVVDAVRRPRLRTSVAIWIWTALATAAHPAGLLATLVAVVALLAVSVLAHDVPARRPLAAIGHVGIGMAIGAVVWLPLGERIVMFGQHFSDVLEDPGHWLSRLFYEPVPQGTFAIVVYLGYAGMIAALWSRRATPVFIATMVLVMLVALVDAPYLAFDLAPSQFTARLGAMRFYGLVRPFVFVAAGYVAWLLIDHVRARWRGADRRSVLVASFIAGISLGATARFGCQSVNHQISDLRLYARFRSHNNEPLVAWARMQTLMLGPQRWARALFVDGTPQHMHLTALTGLPTFQHGPTPNVLLRERMEDLSPESLRRFNVRWIVHTKPDAPIWLGDEKTEKVIDGFKLREVPTWDGQFARIERGSGRATVTRLDDRAVDVELTATTQPALVALGMGYYPRWRATSSDGKAIPVYGYPATPGGHRHVVAAWLPPGKTRFTPDGPLPSDGRGRGVAVLGLVLAIAITTVWSRRRWRLRVLRRLARLRTKRLPRRAVMAAIAFGCTALLAWGVIASLAPARALELGSGVRPSATVSFKDRDGSWTECGYVRSLGEYHCGDRAIVGDTTATIVNDEQVLWPYTTPAIAIYPLRASLVEVRIEMTRRLAGRYWVGSRDLPVHIAVGGRSLETAQQQTMNLPDGDHSITITAPPTAAPLWVTFVHEDTLQPANAIPLAPATPAL